MLKVLHVCWIRMFFLSCGVVVARSIVITSWLPNFKPNGIRLFRYYLEEGNKHIIRFLNTPPSAFDQRSNRLSLALKIFITLSEYSLREVAASGISIVINAEFGRARVVGEYNEVSINQTASLSRFCICLMA